ncbi:hypothetical protein LJB42_004512 [Komagataella kurtzmanii]|nr:hypothetical protein LJB42_004512 [Komagataella kurtzmanii]
MSQDNPPQQLSEHNETSPTIEQNDSKLIPADAVSPQATQELGGAQALLQLGNKTKDTDETEKKFTQDLASEAVEAAVMRFVGGNLDSKKRHFTEDMSNITELQQWTGFLDEDFNFQPQNKKKKTSSTHNGNGNSHLSGTEDDSGHRIRNSNTDSNGNKSHHTNQKIDPELAQLDSEAATDHDQYVQNVLMDARTLAQLDQDYLRHHDIEISQQQLAAQASQAAAQIMAAAVGDVGDDNNKKDSDRQQGNHLGHNAGEADLKPNGGHDEAAELVAAAAAKASNWISGGKTYGKLFGKEECEAIDAFIMEYCKIHNMTRDDICHRIWSNDRKKDDFWDSLHRVLEHRSRSSLYKHVRRTYHIFQTRGKWTPEEEEELARLATEQEGQWKLIGMKMGRMPEDCRDRWRNYIKCGNRRMVNKWSEEEEEKLRQVVHELLDDESSNNVINWTVVSERINGTRSRIQCRYKWNKLLKRDATERALTIDAADRIWLLSRIKELGYTSAEMVDWNALSAFHGRNLWTAQDFKVCFERMRSTIRDVKKKRFEELIDLLLQEVSKELHI